LGRFLVIDDDAGVRKVLARVLENEGHTVSQASSRVEALKLTRSNQFDLVTVDLVMDQMDGVDTIAVLRNEVTCPIIAISAHLSDDLRDELSKLGVSGFLQKPFTTSEVRELIQRFYPS